MKLTKEEKKIVNDLKEVDIVHLTKEDIKEFKEEAEVYSFMNRKGFYDTEVNYFFDESLCGLVFTYFKFNCLDGFFIEYKEDIEPEKDGEEWDMKYTTIKPLTLKKRNKKIYKEFLKFQAYVENHIINKKAV